MREGIPPLPNTPSQRGAQLTTTTTTIIIIIIILSMNCYEVHQIKEELGGI
jgi:hypothetical protein